MPISPAVLRSIVLRKESERQNIDNNAAFGLQIFSGQKISNSAISVGGNDRANSFYRRLRLYSLSQVVNTEAHLCFLQKRQSNQTSCDELKKTVCEKLRTFFKEI
jgi:hypothetical protein